MSLSEMLYEPVDSHIKLGNDVRRVLRVDWEACDIQLHHRVDIAGVDNGTVCFIDRLVGPVCI